MLHYIHQLICPLFGAKHLVSSWFEEIFSPKKKKKKQLLEMTQEWT